MPRSLKIQPFNPHDARVGRAGAGTGPSVFIGAFNKAIATELQQKLLAPQRDVVLNEQQEVVMRWIKKGEGSAIVNARAGTGKTTSLLAFGNAISYQAQASTMHSIGNTLLRRVLPKCELENWKVRNLAQVIWPARKDQPFNRVIVTAAVNAVGMAKQWGFGLQRLDEGCSPIDSDQGWADLIEYYELDDELPESVAPEDFRQKCMGIYHDSIKGAVDKGEIDFDDMILMPLYLSDGKPEMFDWVMIDELQDLNVTRKLLALHVLKTGGRFVGVGDPAQSIYGFTGAMSNAMSLIGEELGAQEFPLPVSYRCPKAVVKLAQRWVPEFQAHESNAEGMVTRMHHSHLWTQEFDPATDVVLCRNTRPLVGVAERLRERGVSCIVEGKSGKGLIKLATKWGGKIKAPELVAHLREYFEEQQVEWVSTGRLDKVERLADKCGIVADAARQLGVSAVAKDVVKKLSTLFGEGENADTALHLATIHRAKGREWETVFLIGRDRYLPSKFAKSQEQLRQEDNLAYVGVTRAMRELVEVVVPGPSKNEVDWWKL